LETAVSALQKRETQGLSLRYGRGQPADFFFVANFVANIVANYVEGGERSTPNVERRTLVARGPP
jgi:hypothetical protein